MTATQYFPGSQQDKRVIFVRFSSGQEAKREASVERDSWAPGEARSRWPGDRIEITSTFHLAKIFGLRFQKNSVSKVKAFSTRAKNLQSHS